MKHSDNRKALGAFRSKHSTIIRRSGVCAFTVLALLSGGCKDDDDEPANGNMQLNLTGLSDLGASQRYEGWVIVNGTPKSTGTFTVNQSGTLSRTTFQVPKADLESASAFVLTVEPVPDADPMPSKIKVLAGNFSGTAAQVSVNHASALGNDFSSAQGRYLLATPTTSDMTDDKRGVWFIDKSTGSDMPGLKNLPQLSNDWKYEGWIVIDGKPVTTGTFKTASGMDEAKPYSGTTGTTPDFPGEDLIMNAPSGVTFPDDLSGQKVVLTIEPFPDFSTEPFILKPLAGDIPANAASDTNYELSNQAAAMPKGSVTR